jgi:hypothetical protein
MGMLGHFLLMVTNIILGYKALCTDGNIRVFKELNGCRQGQDKGIRTKGWGVVPAADQGVLTEEHPMARMSMRCLAQCPKNYF